MEGITSNTKLFFYKQWCFRSVMKSVAAAETKSQILQYNNSLLMSTDFLHVFFSTITLCYTLNNLPVSLDWCTISWNKQMIKLCKWKLFYLRQPCVISICCFITPTFFFLLIIRPQLHAQQRLAKRLNNRILVNFILCLR